MVRPQFMVKLWDLNESPMFTADIKDGIEYVSQMLCSCSQTVCFLKQ